MPFTRAMFSTGINLFPFEPSYLRHVDQDQVGCPPPLLGRWPHPQSSTSSFKEIFLPEEFDLWV